MQGFEKNQLKISPPQIRIILFHDPETAPTQPNPNNLKHMKRKHILKVGEAGWHLKTDR